MRDFLRLLGIAILVFALVGFAMIYSRDSAFRHGVAAFLSGTGGAVSRAFSDATGIGRGEAGSELKSATLRIVRPDQTRWVGLAGFPDQTVVLFAVPPVGGFIDGRLDLHFDIQLAQGGDGLLSIAVNGERRSEIVLDTGHNTYDVSLPLTDADLLGDQVMVELAARGTTNGGQICPTDASNSGSAISLLPESAMVLTTLQQARDPQTALIAAPDPLNLYLGTDTHSQAVTVWAATLMARAGVPSTLVDDPLTPNKIVVTDQTTAPEPVELDLDGTIILNGSPGLRRAIELHRADALAPSALSDWPIAVTSLTTETMARNFRGSKRWTLPYKIADLPGGLTPTRFDLALRTSLLADGDDWIVRVSLNGNLLQTARKPGNVPDIRLPVDLPLPLQGLSNTILVELIDTSPNQSICRAAPDAQAQLLPESTLTAFGAQPADGWGALVRQMAETTYVVPGNHALVDTGQGARVAAMLAQFLPAQARATFDPPSPPTTLTVMDKARLIEVLNERKQAGTAAEGGRAWVITVTGGNATDTLGLSDLQTQDEATVLDQMHPTSMAILVQVPPLR